MANVCSTKRAGTGIDRNSINSGRAENGEMVSSLRGAIFLCPKSMKEKGKLAGGRKTGEGGGSIFRYPSMDSYALVLGAIHPPIGPPSLRSVGETDRWVDTSPNVSCSALSSTLPYIRYFCSISRRRSLWENFRIQKRRRKYVSHSPFFVPSALYVFSLA